MDDGSWRETRQDPDRLAVHGAKALPKEPKGPPALVPVPMPAGVVTTGQAVTALDPAGLTMAKAALVEALPIRGQVKCPRCGKMVMAEAMPPGLLQGRTPGQGGRWAKLLPHTRKGGRRCKASGDLVDVRMD